MIGEEGTTDYGVPTGELGEVGGVGTRDRRLAVWR